jgi:uncharacterized protein
MNHKTLYHYRCCRLAALLVLVLLTVGCARTAPVSHYQLSAMDDETTLAGISGLGSSVIGIGPVRLPEYLDRPQIITRMDSNRLLLADSHRWVEPLADNLSRVIRENLSILLGTERFLIHPWPLAALPDYQVIIEVVRFEGGESGAAYLETVWSIRDGQGQTLLPPHRGRYRAEAAGTDHDAVVAALSKTIARFSEDIARRLTLLHQDRLSAE